MALTHKIVVRLHVPLLGNAYSHFRTLTFLMQCYKHVVQRQNRYGLHIHIRFRGSIPLTYFYSLLLPKSICINSLRQQDSLIGRASDLSEDSDSSSDLAICGLLTAHPLFLYKKRLERSSKQNMLVVSYYLANNIC